MLIGLMSKSGSGKTTLCLLFKEFNPNIHIINIDKFGLQSHDNEYVKQNFHEYFGEQIFDPNCEINRSILYTIVYNNH